MIIRIKEIGASGKKIEIVMPSKWLIESFAMEDPIRDLIKNDVELNFFLSLIGQRVDVSGKFSTELQAECGRCLDNFKYEVNCNVKSILFPAENNKVSVKTKEDLEDIGSGTYSGDKIDLKKIVFEVFTLSLPITFLCSDDCKGLCQYCGVNKNKEMCGCK